CWPGRSPDGLKRRAGSVRDRPALLASSGREIKRPPGRPDLVWLAAVAAFGPHHPGGSLMFPLPSLVASAPRVIPSCPRGGKTTPPSAASTPPGPAITTPAGWSASSLIPPRLKLDDL